MHNSKTLMMKRLRERGFKLTPQRLQIIDIISNNKMHPSAQDLFAEARKKSPRISASTVYYTLELLKREGLIKEIDFYDRPNRYDSDTSEHLNLVCLKCGKIEDFNDDLPVSFKKIEEETGFMPLNLRFEYHGYCKECRQKMV